MRTCRAAAATAAQAARTSSGRETSGIAVEGIQVREAGAAEAEALARLLHEFNLEYDEPAPGVEWLAARLRDLLAGGEIVALVAERGGPLGLALLRFRPSLWDEGAEAHLQELYVVPPQRGEGIGRGLLEAAMEAARAAGATTLDLNTATADTAAIGLYESAGFTNREGGPGGPSMLFYEREL